MCHLEAWTVTRNGALHPDVKRHYIRINPVQNGPPFDEDPDTRMLTIRNRPPGSRVDFPAKDIVDAGFLELVRYGIRKPGDPLIEDSLAVVDRVLRFSTPFGPSFRRFNHDGYGQRDDGGPFEGWGRGRGWPLLTGERGHYELAAGRRVEPYLHAMEGFATATGLLPEQIWDEADLPGSRLYLGRATGSAMPLAWAHAEYVKLLRSRRDGIVFDLVPEVAARYGGPSSPDRLEVWKRNRQPASIPAGRTLRVMGTEAFHLRYTTTGWRRFDEAPSRPTSLGVHFVDVAVRLDQAAPIEFTFRWLSSGEWEGTDHRVNVSKGSMAR